MRYMYVQAQDASVSFQDKLAMVSTGLVHRNATDGACMQKTCGDRTFHDLSTRWCLFVGSLYCTCKGLPRRLRYKLIIMANLTTRWQICIEYKKTWTRVPENGNEKTLRYVRLDAKHPQYWS